MKIPTGPVEVRSVSFPEWIRIEDWETLHFFAAMQTFIHGSFELRRPGNDTVAIVALTGVREEGARDE